MYIYIHTYILHISNTVVTHCCLAMATFVVRTHRNITLYVHFLSCLFIEIEKNCVGLTSLFYLVRS